MSEPVTLVLCNYRGMAVRNFGMSRFPEAISREGRLVVLSDSAGEEYEQLDFGAERLPYPACEVDNYLLFLLKDSFFRAHGIKTHLMKEERLKRRPAQRLGSLAVRAMPGISGFRALDRYAGLRLRRSQPVRELAAKLRELRPCVLLDVLHNTIAGAGPLEAARLAGVPACGFVHSWDKLTTKQPIHGEYDRYFVWGDPMKQELLQLYPWTPPEHVIPTGTPQFDFYYDSRYLLSREELCRALRVDPNRPLLTYATVSTGYSAGEERVLARLIRALQEKYGRDVPNLIIRPRPDPVNGDAERFAPLEALDPERVRVMRSDWIIRPGSTPGTKWGRANEVDQVRYTSLVRHTDVGLAISSTVVLEWLLCDRPVVSFCFDPDNPSRPDPTSRWMVEFTHYRFVREGPGVAFAEALQPTLVAIDRFLKDPSHLSEGRRRMRCEVTGYQDGHAAGRIAMEALNLSRQAPFPQLRRLGAVDPASLLPPVSPLRVLTPVGERRVQ